MLEANKPASVRARAALVRERASRRVCQEVVSCDSYRKTTIVDAASGQSDNLLREGVRRSPRNGLGRCELRAAGGSSSNSHSFMGGWWVRSMFPFVWNADDSWAALAMILVVLVLVTVLGLVVAAIGWAGLRVARTIGALVFLFGLMSLICFSLEWQSLWWWSIPPIYAGWLALTAWRGRELSPRRPFQFTLRGLLTFVLAITLTMGGAITYYRRQHAEERLIAQLDSRTITVHQWTFGRASYILLNPGNEQEFSQSMAVLRQLGDLRSLQVNNGDKLPTSITEQLGELTNLRTISVQHLPLRDADLKPLGRLVRLESLDLDGSMLTDSGLHHLYPLKRLTRLWLYHTDATQLTSQGRQQLRATLPYLQD